MKKASLVLIAIFLAFTIPYGGAKVISELVGEAYFIRVLIHRLSQTGISILLFLLIFRKSQVKLGFDFKTFKRDIIRFKLIFIFWPVATGMFFLVMTVFVDGFAGYITQLYPMEIGSAAIQLGRDALMLDALAEEVLYRALIIQLMGLCWTREVGFGRVQLTQAAWLSIPIFALSHVQVSFFPFRIIGYDPIQLGLTVLTGFIFAYAYEKTQALVLPILIHGYTNLIITITAYAIVIIK